MLLLNLDYQENNLYAKLEGKLTKKESYKIDYYVIPFILTNQVRTLYFDCERLSKIDFDGKYSLLKAKLTLKKQKGNLVLFNVKKNIKNDLIGYRMRILTK